MLLDKVTIGNSVESIAYAYLNDNYFLPTLLFGPLFYEKISPPIFGTDRKDFTWSRLQLLMSLMGKLLNYQNINNITITDDEMKISTADSLWKYRFGVCNIFDPTAVRLENEIEEKADHVYRVYDDFELSNLGAKHEFLESKKSKDILAKEIHYYTSSRVDGANYVTDCVVESRLNKQQINCVDYSDSIVRFAVLRHLDHLGIRGNFMNLYKSGEPKYRKPKVIHRKRIVVPQEKNKYKDSCNIKFLNLTMREILDEFGP